ncbi:MAG: flagellar basal body L-ring protein FlgH [Bdellovibrionaceae bacterium]|nr:flagellar basal body L-ring protein FlgH [Pseudobdellovibrionaceae bacterium]
MIQRLLFPLSLAFLLSACASMQDFVGDSAVGETLIGPRTPRYSETPQLASGADRQYRRMTRSRMEEESDLGSQAGSMWVPEGQTSYLFVQNKTRREGDILNVKLEGAGLKQVETKVGVIKKLLKQLEEQQQQPGVDGQRLAGGGADRAPAAAPNDAKKAADEKEDLGDLQAITTRIVEKLPDGNYRVKGSQPFMIGKREYKVILTGLVRPEDYNDEGINSGKLLDPQYDVVSVRRKQNNEANKVL